MTVGAIDPVCAFHGKRWSEHDGGRCLYCCLCFVTLTPDACWQDADGQRWDMCAACGAQQAEHEARQA